jgi:hypothetical protein
MVQELLLIVSNGASDPNAAPVVLQSDPPLAISASNVACWKWQGNATVEHFADRGGASEHHTSRATNVLDRYRDRRAHLLPVDVEGREGLTPGPLSDFPQFRRRTRR